MICCNLRSSAVGKTLVSLLLSIIARVVVLFKIERNQAS